MTRGRTPSGPRWKDYGDPADPDGFHALIARFLQDMAINHYSVSTSIKRQVHLGQLVAWCHERSLTQPKQITRRHLDQYKAWAFYRVKEDGNPTEASTQSGMLVSVRMFFRWLTRKEYLAMNPASELDLPRTTKKLPKAILTPDEVEKVLLQADLTTPLGLRDRAIMETFWSTAIRRNELICLNVADLDHGQGVVYVRKGKGGKDRAVPLGERCVHWINRYLVEVRPRLTDDTNDTTLFLSQRGGAISKVRMTQTVREYIVAANTGKVGACHIFRHSAATAMLENGADIRFIQELLGHAELSTTSIYTRVAIAKLKAVHSATHPGAKYTPDDGSAARPLAAEAAAAQRALQAAALLESLAEEDDDESPDVIGNG